MAGIYSMFFSLFAINYYWRKNYIAFHVLLLRLSLNFEM